MDSSRQHITELIGLPSTSEAPTAQLIDRQPEDGYTRSLLRYSAPDGDQIEALLFEPIGKIALGGVLALHQHNSQWTIGKSEIAGMAGDPLQAFGPALACRGVTVLAPDAIGFESRTGTSGAGASLAPRLTKPGSSADGWLQYYNQMAHRLVRGDLLMRKMLLDYSAGIAVLQSISSARIGAIGHSMGGGITLFLAALDTRIAFACSSGAACSYRYRLAHGIGLEMAQVIPGFANQFDIDDLMRCIAPRRLLVVSADDDFASADATDLLRKARPAFEALHCSERLMHFHVPGGHALDQRRFDTIVDWAVAQAMTAQ